MATIKQFEEVMGRLDRNIGIAVRSRLVAETTNIFNTKANCIDDDLRYLSSSLLQFLGDDITALKSIWKELKEKSRFVKNLTKFSSEDLMRIMN